LSNAVGVSNASLPLVVVVVVVVVWTSRDISLRDRIFFGRSLVLIAPSNTDSTKIMGTHVLFVVCIIY
jgi:hypothetical protein